MPGWKHASTWWMENQMLKMWVNYQRTENPGYNAYASARCAFIISTAEKLGLDVEHDFSDVKQGYMDYAVLGTVDEIVNLLTLLDEFGVGGFTIDTETREEAQALYDKHDQFKRQYEHFTVVGPDGWPDSCN